MKLDPTVLRTMNAQDFRVMEAVEKGMRDHEVVPTPLISSLANLRHGGAHKIISSLLRDKLLSHECKKHGFDGYRLTNAGYDILALHNLKSRGLIAALGPRIGTGKESDIYLACTPTGQQLVLKFHRLGRTSFRNVKKKRDYFGRASQQAHSWLLLSKLSALKEYAFMKALYDVQYPTPTPVAHNRHIVAMGLVRGVPLYQIYPKQLSVEQAADIYQQALALATRLAQHGLVHCDLNEFNLMVDLSGIQALATTAEDPYVRHSGQSVVTGQHSSSLGLLSRPAWEISLQEEEQGEQALDTTLPEPAARLPNGEPKPVVTLIDFPQMISTKHPNAQELYERDKNCLRRFFELKLLCQIPDDADAGTEWHSVVQKTCLELSQERLDEELRASGFNDKLSAGLELYYFDSGAQAVAAIAMGTETVPEEDHEYGESDEDEHDDHADYNIKNNIPNVDIPSLPVTEKQQPAQEGNPAVVMDEIPLPTNIAAEDEDGTTDRVLMMMMTTTTTVVVQVEDTASIILSTMDRQRVEQEAKNRVRRQLEDQKKKQRKSGAFQTRNNNKSYVKGKRVLRDPF